MAKQFSVFLLVGILNTIVGFGFYALFLALGMHYVAAVLFSTCCGVLFNYFSTGKLVFAKNNNSKIVHFFMAYALVYFINIGAIKALLLLGFDKYSAFFISAPVLALISFSLMKWFVFTDKQF